MFRIVICGTFALLILVYSVSCFYMQTRNDVSNHTNLNSEISKNPKTDNMQDLFIINETVEKTFPVSSKTKVKVYSFEGEITVKAENTSVVKMRATKMAVDKDAADGVKYSFSEEKGVVNLKADFVKPDRKVNYGKHTFYAKGAYVLWEVIVPTETDLVLETEHGQIDVRNVDGEIKLSTKNGSITATDCKGRLDSTTLNGKVQISGQRGSADVVSRSRDPILIEGDFQNLSVLSGGGKISVGLAKSSGGTVETDTRDISARDFVLSQAGRNEEGWQKYSFGTGNSNIRIQSNNGRVSIYSY